MIIPADEHSPGARAARVAAYIDARLAEAWDDKDRTDWREGLKRVDELSQEMHGGRPFMQSSAGAAARRPDADGAEREASPRSPRSSSSAS